MDLIAKSIYKIKTNNVSFIPNSDEKKSYYKFPLKRMLKNF